MKTKIRCRCCGDQTNNATTRHDRHYGAVCPECYNVMNGHLGLWAVGLIEGVIFPQPIREKEEHL